MQSHGKNQYFEYKVANARHRINYKWTELLLCFMLPVFLFYEVGKSTIKVNKDFCKDCILRVEQAPLVAAPRSAPRL